MLRPLGRLLSIQSVVLLQQMQHCLVAKALCLLTMKSCVVSSVRRLRSSVVEAEEEADSWSQAQSAGDPQPTSQTLLALPAHKEGREASNAEEWKLKTARTSRRKRLSPSLRCPGRTASLLCTLTMKDRSHQRRCWGRLSQPDLVPE